MERDEVEIDKKNRSTHCMFVMCESSISTHPIASVHLPNPLSLPPSTPHPNSIRGGNYPGCFLAGCVCVCVWGKCSRYCRKGRRVERWQGGGSVAGEAAEGEEGVCCKWKWGNL